MSIEGWLNDTRIKPGRNTRLRDLAAYEKCYEFKVTSAVPLPKSKAALKWVQDQGFSYFIMGYDRGPLAVTYLFTNMDDDAEVVFRLMWADS